jgi:hypothetical protein
MRGKLKRKRKTGCRRVWAGNGYWADKGTEIDFRISYQFSKSLKQNYLSKFKQWFEPFF